MPRELRERQRGRIRNDQDQYNQDQLTRNRTTRSNRKNEPNKKLNMLNNNMKGQELAWTSTE